MLLAEGVMEATLEGDTIEGASRPATAGQREGATMRVTDDHIATYRRRGFPPWWSAS